MAKQNPIESLSMIDSVQILGIEYHFEEEIQAVLQRQQLMFGSQTYRGNDDHELSEVALQFRLLRQEGYWIHANVFDNFMDSEGKLKQKFWGNIEGLTALFEASQLSIEGEDCLDEAGNLSCQLLNAWVSRFHDHHQAKAIANTLRCPIYKSLPKFMPTNSQLQNSGWTSSLQELSKLDTHIMSSLQLKEICAFSKWWKDQGLAKDLKFARDEPIKWYMWSLACLPGPHSSEERIELTKPLSLFYIIDDIFDVYGSIEELTLFTDAVYRWNLKAMEQLPDYMKACYKALYDITYEFALKIQRKHGWNPIDTLTKSWMRLCNAFLEEAKWFNSGHLPKARDYLNNAVASTGVQLVLLHTFFLMGDGINKETVSIMDGFPSLVSSTATILRLHDDLEGIKDEKQDEKDGSYMKCYMKEHPEVSAEETIQLMNEKISDAWKCLNRYRIITPTNPFPSSFTRVCLNTARMIPLMYGYESNSSSRLEEYVKSLLSRSEQFKGTPQDEVLT
ncbi:hypothetical protein L6164_036485 [Bauhinia variegata]|uniref:Uncharacterized protein n=1 Tax=Bauhinia variegata TaxID=167791 RepID=A0ACB9KH92_BAUVA|nr:hypothetical protein L6164_036485 [Bauhinia variegata]